MIDILAWIAIVALLAFPVGGVAMAIWTDIRDRNKL